MIARFINWLCNAPAAAYFIGALLVTLVAGVAYLIIKGT